MEVYVTKDTEFNNLYLVSVEYNTDHRQTILCTFEMLKDLEKQISQLKKPNDLP